MSLTPATKNHTKLEILPRDNGRTINGEDEKKTRLTAPMSYSRPMGRSRTIFFSRFAANRLERSLSRVLNEMRRMY